MSSGGIEYSNVAEIKGPLVIVDGVENAAFDELVEIETKEGEHRLGKVLEIGNGKAIIQVFEGTTGSDVQSALPVYYVTYQSRKIWEVFVHELVLSFRR